MLSPVAHGGLQAGQRGSVVVAAMGVLTPSPRDRRPVTVASPLGLSPLALILQQRPSIPCPSANSFNLLRIEGTPALGPRLCVPGCRVPRSARTGVWPGANQISRGRVSVPLWCHFSFNPEVSLACLSIPIISQTSAFDFMLGSVAAVLVFLCMGSVSLMLPSTGCWWDTRLCPGLPLRDG